MAGGRKPKAATHERKAHRATSSCARHGTELTRSNVPALWPDVEPTLDARSLYSFVSGIHVLVFSSDWTVAGM